MKKTLIRLLPVLVIAAFITTGCNQATKTGGAKMAKPAAQAKKAKNVYKGKIAGKSNKAKTISITVGKGKAMKTMMVKFNDATKGVEHAVKGRAAIIKFKMVGKDKVATMIKPKIAKLPAGVTQISPDEVAKQLAAGAKIALVDSRPPARFHEGSIPTAINASVGAMKKKAAKLLPPNKDIQLVFFCGGVT